MACRTRLLASVAIPLFLGGAVAGAQTAVQRVTFQVVALNRMSVSGDPPAMVITTADAGAAPTPVTASGGTYAITTNENNRKITATLDQTLPTGVTLEVALAAPTGASSSGHVALTTAGADVVTGISNTTAAALPISYRLSATESVHMPSAETRVVTFTILAAP